MSPCYRYVGLWGTGAKKRFVLTAESRCDNIKRLESSCWFSEFTELVLQLLRFRTSPTPRVEGSCYSLGVSPQHIKLLGVPLQGEGLH